MYPMLREDVSLRKSKNKNFEKPRYFVMNGQEEEFEISHRLYLALLEADGTKPLMLPDMGKKIVPRLKKDKIVHTSRIVHLGGPFLGIILLPIGNNVQKHRRLFKIINYILPFASMLSFIIGISLKLLTNISGAYFYHSEVIIWLYYLLFWLSIMVHEIGHLNAGIAYGYKICSIGLLFIGCFPVGAYVSYNQNMNYNKHLTQKEKIQFSLSGIEFNLLMAGLLAFVSVIINNHLSQTLIAAANINIILSILNSLPAVGLDGEKALSAFLEVDSIFITALEWMFDKSRRKKLLAKGFIGYVCIAFFSSILVVQVFIVLLIISDFISLIIQTISIFYSFRGHSRSTIATYFTDTSITDKINFIIRTFTD